MHIIIFIVSKKVDVLCHFTPHFTPIKPHRHPPLTSKKQPQSSLTSYPLPLTSYLMNIPHQILKVGTVATSLVFHLGAIVIDGIHRVS